MKDVSVIIPAYNEADCLLQNLRELSAYLSASSWSWEVILVDDGSTDATLRLMEEYCATEANASYLHFQPNRGKGYAVRQGMLAATGSIRLYMDADLSTPLDTVARAVACARQGHSLVLASRRLAESKLAVRQSRTKELLGILGNWSIRGLLGLSDFPDTQCGFKALSASLAEQLLPQLRIDRWGFDFELVALAQNRGARIKQLPVTWSNRASSRVTYLSYFRTLLELVRLKWQLGGASRRWRSGPFPRPIHFD